MAELSVSVVAFAALLLISVASAFEFRVGGDEGWVKPGTGNASESYNHWAGRNRFHIGDSVYFKYVNDSVLVVNRESYSECNVTRPLLRFGDGNTTFRFDRYGFFYFISGQPDHCNADQKLIIRVMVHPEHVHPAAPGPAPLPDSSGDRDVDSVAPAGTSGSLRVAAAAGSSVAGLAALAFIVVTVFV